jgi:hypothetical protein
MKIKMPHTKKVIQQKVDFFSRVDFFLVFFQRQAPMAQGCESFDRRSVDEEKEMRKIAVRKKMVEIIFICKSEKLQQVLASPATNVQRRKKL